MPTSPHDGRPSHRIAKLLARAGIASRREIERMIAEGRVAIDGVPVETPATLLASLDGVTVDGQPVAAPEAARLFLFHKPPGLLTTERDPRGRPTIYDKLPRKLPRLMPVGRLDLATEGLLLMTTDGGLKRQLELPATGVERAYRARAYGQISQPQLEELIHGIEIDGVRYGAIDANIERRTGANVWIELVLTEGKNREVRRVLEHLGLQVSRLIRTRYGPFVLGDLPPGEIGEVRPHDVDSFRADPRRRELPQPSRRGLVRLEREPAPNSEDRAARIAAPRTRPGVVRPMRPADQPARGAQREPEGTRRLRPGAAPKRVATASAASGEQRAGSDRPATSIKTARPSGKDSPRQRADGSPAVRSGTARVVSGEQRAASDRPAKLAKPARPGGKDGPRRRADGSLATRSGSARAERARTHRETQGDTPPRPTRPRGR